MYYKNFTNPAGNKLEFHQKVSQDILNEEEILMREINLTSQYTASDTISKSQIAYTEKIYSYLEPSNPKGELQLTPSMHSVGNKSVKI